MSATDASRARHGDARRRKVTLGGVGLALLGWALHVWAGGPTITEADIERAQREQPTITDQDIEAVRRAYGASGPAVVGQPPVPAAVAVDALPQPATRTPIDLEALARGYASQSDAMAAAQGLASGPGLFVFVSLSLPRASLERLLDQAARARASVILRGFAQGSMRATVAQIQQIIGERQVAVQVDPLAFDRFSITHVPSFVLVRDGARPVSCAAGTCAPPEDHARIAGDVSLDYALAYVQRVAPDFGAEATMFLERLGQ